MQKNFYAIIPAFIRYDKRLPMLSRFLYGELTALCSEKGYCWASNRYFAELYEVSIETISRYIAKLKEFGYIRITYDSSKKDNDRRIYITDIPIENIELTTETKAEPEEEDTTTPLTKTSNTLDENIKPPLMKTSMTLDENIKHNNTCNITINNTESDARARPLSDFEKFIIDFLVYYQKLTGHAVSDINQAPFFRSLKNREELKSIFEARRYNASQCLKFAFEIAEKRPPDKRFFSFWDCLKVYLQNGNDGQIVRYYTEAEREERGKIKNQKIEIQQAEAEKLEREQRAEAEKLNMTLEEYQNYITAENERAMADFEKRMQAILANN